jgi:hypothetical protein
MITSNDINIISDNDIEQKVVKYRDKLKAYQQKIIEDRKVRVRQAYEAKKKAQQKIPAILKTIEGKILNATSRKNRHIEYECGPGLCGKYLMVMLFDMLPLDGFECEPSYYNRDNSTIIIRW